MLWFYVIRLATKAVMNLDRFTKTRYVFDRKNFNDNHSEGHSKWPYDNIHCLPSYLFVKGKTYLPILDHFGANRVLVIMRNTLKTSSFLPLTIHNY